MQILSQNFDTLWNQIVTPPGWIQIGVIAAGFGLAWILARLAREKIPEHFQSSALKIGAGSMQRLALPLLALVFIWIGKIALSRVLPDPQPAPILNVAVLLVAAFAMIRLSVYLLRHLFPLRPSLKAWERVFAFVIWAVAASYLTGILPYIYAALDEVSFTVGKREITLLTVIHALLSVLLTLFITLTLSIIVENRVMKAQSLDTGMRVFAGKLVRALAFVVAILIALPLMGIDITVLSVFGGALGVGLGLGLQKIASNYVSGFVILLDRSIRPGDLVTIADRQGVVSDIRARYTVVRGLDGIEAIVPNDSIISSTVLNHSYTDRAVAIKTTVTISYQSNTASAMSLLLAAGVSQARVLLAPEPTVWIKHLGDNGIELELTTWIRDAEDGSGSLRSGIFVDVLRDFHKEGIEMPTPQREIRIRADANIGPLPTVAQASHHLIK